jgi:hypothetical protein
MELLRIAVVLGPRYCQSKMIELSRASRQRVMALFREEDVPQAEQLLAQSADSPQLLADVSRQNLDRMLFAMIRLSGGTIERLEQAIQLFRRDWRDLLWAAEFGEDIHAHERWQPRRFDRGVVEQWLLGDKDADVEFLANDTVEVLSGLARGKKGKVVTLVSLEPEPRYLVDFGKGDSGEHYQRVLLRRPG